MTRAFARWNRSRRDREKWPFMVILQPIGCLDAGSKTDVRDRQMPRIGVQLPTAQPGLVWLHAAGRRYILGSEAEQPHSASGTTVTINDTAPTTDRYNLIICEILPAP